MSNYQIWYTQKFKSLLGGIEVTKKEKDQNLILIKEAINQNNKGIITELDQTVFAKSYPESINYIKEYYASLLNAKVSNSIGWEKHYYTSKEEALKYHKPKIATAKRIMLMIYAPILVEADIQKIITTLDISLTDITIILNNYKLILAKDKKTIKDLTKENAKYKIAQLIATEILENDMTKKRICQKYKIGNQAFDTFIENLKEINSTLYQETKLKINNNSSKYYQSIKSLIRRLGNYIENGIVVGEEKIPFTILDYYCLTSMSLSDFQKFIKNEEIDSKENFKYRNLVSKFIFQNMDVGPFVSSQIIANKKITFIIKEKRVEITQEIGEEVINILKKEGIPTNNKIVYNALQRYARENPILPLKEIENIELSKTESPKRKHL